LKQNNPSLHPANPLAISNWDEMIAAQPDASIFHGAAWAKVLTETYGYVPNYLAEKNGERIQSLLPLMEVDSWLTGRRGIGLPFTDNCEPLCQDAVSFQKLFRNAIDFGKSRGWKSLEIRGGQKFFGDASPSLSFSGHNLDLDLSVEQLFENLESSVRRAVRKAEKDEVQIEISPDLEAVKMFYLLQCKTRKKYGLPPQPFSFFLNVHRHILSQDLGAIVLARWRKIPIAGAVYFWLGKNAIYKYGASDEKYQQLRGSNLVMWEAIKWLARRGAKKLNLGRTSMANEGLRRFKLGWGATEEKSDYFKYDLREEKFVTERDEAFGWHNGIFRLLPVFASRMAGNVLYKHWA
jgi:hypothetical protein